MLLAGKTALITGCLKGIGFETMQLFARNGASIYACCQSADDSFETARTELAAQTGVTITPLYFDLAREGEVKSAMRQLLSTKAAIDILLNIAGMTEDARFPMTTAQSIRRVYEINFVASMLITQSVSRLMALRRSGSIVNVSSISALDGNEGQLSYSASKAALLGATRTLASELAPQNIRVNAIAPGVIETDMTAAIPVGAREKLKSRIAMRRLGQASEVAGVLLFLASDLSRYITGQVIRVDGGIG
jgi:3-oxoacyl-[acyl-carrier protein] reductase